MVRAAERRREGFGAVPRDEAAAADVPLGDRPVLRAPRGRARLRQSRVQRAAGGIADISGLRPTDRRLRHRAKREDADDRPERREREREPPRAGRDRGERGRRRGDEDAEQRLLEADRGADATAARRLRRGDDREPVPRHREDAGDDERGDQDRERRVDERGDERPSRRRDRRRSTGSARAAPECDPTSVPTRCARRCRGR